MTKEYLWLLVRPRHSLISSSSPDEVELLSDPWVDGPVRFPWHKFITQNCIMHDKSIAYIRLNLVLSCNGMNTHENIMSTA